MKVLINGEEKKIDHPMTVSELLAHFSIDLTQNKIAVEINASICPRHEHQTTQLKNNDKIEIITAVGGG